MKHKSNLLVFGYDECPYCMDLKNRLNDNNIDYFYHDIDSDEGSIEYDKILKHCESEFLPLIVVDYNILTADKSFNTIEEAFNLIIKLLKKI